MAIKKASKNLLPLLALTALMLSVGIVNYFNMTNQSSGQTTKVLGASTIADFLFR